MHNVFSIKKGKYYNSIDNKYDNTDFRNFKLEKIFKKNSNNQIILKEITKKVFPKIKKNYDKNDKTSIEENKSTQCSLGKKILKPTPYQILEKIRFAQLKRFKRNKLIGTQVLNIQLSSKLSNPKNQKVTSNFNPNSKSFCELKSLSMKKNLIKNNKKTCYLVNSSFSGEKKLKKTSIFYNFNQNLDLIKEKKKKDSIIYNYKNRSKTNNSKYINFKNLKLSNFIFKPNKIL